MEISRNVLAVLLLLVIVMSGFGTWALLSREPVSPAPQQYNEPPKNGEVSLSIVHVPSGQGVVALDVVPAKKVVSNG